MMLLWWWRWERQVCSWMHCFCRPFCRQVRRALCATHQVSVLGPAMLGRPGLEEGQKCVPSLGFVGHLGMVIRLSLEAERSLLWWKRMKTGHSGSMPLLQDRHSWFRLASMGNPRAVPLSWVHTGEQLHRLCHNVHDIRVVGCFALYLDFLVDGPVFGPVIFRLCESGLLVGSPLPSCQTADYSITLWLAVPQECHLGGDICI